MHPAAVLDTDSCSVVPVYRNVCGADIYPCIGRTTTAIPLRCAASDASGGCSYGWFHARDLITISDATLVVEGSDLPAPTPGYWWCDILDQSLNPQSCSLSVPAIHIYPCTCKDADSTSLQICPTNNRSCRRTLLDPCPPGLSLYCLTTTRVELLTQVILTATKTVPVTTETKRTATVQTRGIPYHVASSSEHGVTTTQTMSPLLTGMNNTRMATNLSVLPLYVVGPIVVVVVISIFVLLVAIGCIKHRRKRLGTREGSNYSTMCVRVCFLLWASSVSERLGVPSMSCPCLPDP